MEKVELDFQFQFKFFEVRGNFDVMLLRCSKSGQNGWIPSHVCSMRVSRQMIKQSRDLISFMTFYEDMV